MELYNSSSLEIVKLFRDSYLTNVSVQRHVGVKL